MRFTFLFGIALCASVSCFASVTQIEKANPSVVPREPRFSAQLQTDTGTVRPGQEGQAAAKQGDQTQPITFWQLVESGNPPALGVLAQLSIGIGTIFIGFAAWRLNANTRKGQVAHEHILMLLDIDKALMASPELITMYGKKYVPELQGETEEASAQRVQKKELIGLEIKQESFFLLHVNMFEYIFDFYGTKWFLRSYETEKWEAWKTYIKRFMTEYNPKTRGFWNTHRDLYAKSFREFMDNISGQP
jgi:hypothetical protein